MTVEVSEREQVWEDVRTAASIRRGVLLSMRRIRTQLMTRGEWNDPAVLPLDELDHRLAKTPGPLDLVLAARVQHEHSTRWVVRQVRKAQTARGDKHN